MNEQDVSKQLSEISTEAQVETDLARLVDRWSALRIGSEVIRPALEFLESHPDWDFGLPGPLVHLIERFYGRGYEERLVESVSSRPTGLTLWMLNRVINGEKVPEKKKQYVEALGHAANSSADRGVRERARHFMSLHGGC